MKDQIAQITLDTMLGIREGVGKVRMIEFAHYITNLIEAKEAGLDVDTIQMPLLSDRVKQGIEAGLSSSSTAGVEGGVTWNIIGLSGNYGKQQQQGIRVKVDMEFMSAGAPDFEKIKVLSVDELKKLMLVVNDETQG